MSESKVKQNNQNREKVARVLAAASILANIDDPIVSKLAEVIGENMASLTPQLISDVLSDRLYQEITAKQKELATELKESIEEVPESRIFLIN